MVVHRFRHVSSVAVAFGAISLCSLYASPAQAQTQVLFNDISNSNDGFAQVAQGAPVYASFSTGAQSLFLTDVKLMLEGQNAGTNSLSIDLFADSATSPGAFVANVGSVSEGSLGAPSTYDFPAAGGIALNANTRYWIGATSPDGFAAWDYTLDNSGPGVPNEFYAGNEITTANSSGPQLMFVSGDVIPTPEPGSLALLSGVFGAGILARRRRKQK